MSTSFDPRERCCAAVCARPVDLVPIAETVRPNLFGNSISGCNAKADSKMGKSRAGLLRQSPAAGVGCPTRQVVWKNRSGGDSVICSGKMLGRAVAIPHRIGEENMHSQLAKQTLESKLLEIGNRAGWRDSIAVRTNADPADTTQQLGEREMACQSLSRSASLVRHLRAALNRVAEGTYGVCVDCEEPIAPKRLAAVPWTPRCLSCQNAFEVAGVQDEELAA